MFRLQQVAKCSKCRAHDWTECPFAHPGEKARRRDPTKFSYSGSACPDFRKVRAARRVLCLRMYCSPDRGHVRAREQLPSPRC
jgi:hypothetical protein